MRRPPLRLLLPVALATGLVVRRRRRSATPGPTPERPVAATRSSAAPAPRRAGRHRRGRPVALALLVLAVVAPLAPASSEGPCEPTPDGMRLVVADLGGDGDVREVTTDVVGLDGTRCTTVPDPDIDVLGVRVGILHSDLTGAAIEPTRLTVSDVPIATRVRVTDTTRERTEFFVDGPNGTVTDTRQLGVPRSVRITVRYPSGWFLTAAPAEGTAVHDGRGGVEVTRSVLLFPPFTPDHVVVSAQAQPGRGTPTVIVESTPADAVTLRALLDRTDDRAALAVIGALLDLTADGADELVDGVFQLADGLDELADATAELADGVDELADGVQELLDGVDALVDGVRELRDGTREFADGLGDVADASRLLSEGLDGLAGIAALLSASASAANLPDDEDDPLIIDPLIPNVTGLPIDPPIGPLFPVPSTPPSAGGFTASLAALSAALTQTASGLATLSTGLATLADAGDDLADGVDELLAGVLELRDGVAELRDGTRELADGTRELADATREVADGARELAEGAEELPEAMREILGIADRRADTLALDEAAVDAGLERGDEQRAGAALVSVRLEHTGQPALPVMAAAATGSAVAAAGGLGWLMRRRRDA